MRIPFGNRQLTINLERVAPAVPGMFTLDGATDREMERFVRAAKTVREPRWEAAGQLYGIHR